jgi:hypothetical protein
MTLLKQYRRWLIQAISPLNLFVDCSARRNELSGVYLLYAYMRGAISARSRCGIHGNDSTIEGKGRVEWVRGEKAGGNGWNR